MIVVGALVVGALIYAVVIYNDLVRLKTNIVRNWSNIDVLLKQRFDELPKLVEVCKGYMQHERETLEAVTQARNDAAEARDESSVLESQARVTRAVRRLFAVSESYPNLKADQAFLRLQARITEIENMIADRREYYNESVNIHNARIEQFPDLFIARNFGFHRRPFWAIDPNERDTPGATFRPAD
ncbi:MAG: LemA family protein [Deltaproteobacteria bacterium]|nr:LemA family protein [bacterium]MCB9487298.1 LemA family protein [Deltaproteobacteria bacterium]